MTAIATGGATITAMYANHSAAVVITINASFISGPSVQACGMITTSGAYTLDVDISQPTPAGLCLKISANGVRLDCHGHSVTGVLVSGATDVTVTNCASTSNGGMRVENSSRVVLDAVQTPTIVLLHGHDNQVVHSTIDGGFNGIGTTGEDDGILLGDQQHDTIQGNAIANVWDAGIEGVDNVSNTTIANNSIANAAASGIASYWCTNWTGNTISQNSVSHASDLFYFAYQTSSAKCLNASTPVAFANNRIIGNVYRDQSPGGIGETMWFDFTASPTGAVVGNLLQGNDLGNLAGPYTVPAIGFSDGGGNICAPATSPFCHG